MLACETSTGTLGQKYSQYVSSSDSIKILALGDSYTIGTSLSESESWPYQLRDSLKVRGIPVEQLRIIARNGWTTGLLLNAIREENLQIKYDLVGLLIGVNNQFQGRSIDEYEAHFKQLLEIAFNLTDNDTNRVFVMSIPDYTATPRGKRISAAGAAREIDMFNSINKRISNQFSVLYLDITPLSRTAADDIDLVAADDLHFSGKMHTLWIELILGDILLLLNYR